MSTTSTTTIRRSVAVASEEDLVWLAWTRPDRLVRWFAPEAVVEPRVGGAFELYFIPGNRESMNTGGCRVLRLAEPRLLEFTWRGPDSFATLMNDEERLTVVTVEMASRGDAVEVVVTHSGFGEGAEWSEAREWHDAAWAQALESLKGALETGEGDLCCR